MSKIELALADMRRISRMTDTQARMLARRQGLRNVHGWLAGEVAHAVVSKAYGEKTYRAARRRYFGMK